jgi:replicative DNA helicase
MDADPTPAFAPYEEQAVVSLILDFPEYFEQMSRFVASRLFVTEAARWVVEAIKHFYDVHNVVPTRQLLAAQLESKLTPDDPHEEILALVARESNPREVPVIRETLRNWIERRMFDLLYSDEALAAHRQGNFDFLRSIVEEATQLRETGQQGFWFFDQLEELLREPDTEHLPTGFPRLDAVLNSGGPSPGETLLWMAPTNVGKTLIMCNNAAAALRHGLDVLYVSFELSTRKTAIRTLGALTRGDIRLFGRADTDELGSEGRTRALEQKESKIRRARALRRGNAHLVIYDLPPDEYSVTEISAILRRLSRLRGWHPKVVILDYLELMVSRRARQNDDDYKRQKAIATEIRGLAAKEHVFVISGTQANRAALEAMSRRAVVENEQPQRGNIGLGKSAESFGKTMPTDYIITINQDEEEYRGTNGSASMRFFVAKNRNGPKFISVPVTVLYKSMWVFETK